MEQIAPEAERTSSPWLCDRQKPSPVSPVTIVDVRSGVCLTAAEWRGVEAHESPSNVRVTVHEDLA